VRRVGCIELIGIAALAGAWFAGAAAGQSAEQAFRLVSAASDRRERDECDSSYPTVCIAPAPPDLDCADVPYKTFAVEGSDPHGFDADFDGVGCEAYPR
jgi:hypothetical protein